MVEKFIGGLKREIELRTILYETERDGLLSYGDDVEWKALGDVSDSFDNNRVPITKNLRRSGDYPYYGASGIVDYIDSYIFDGEYLLISEDGVNLITRKTPIAFIVNDKFWANNHTHVLKLSSRIKPMFIKWFLNSKDLAPYITGYTIPKITQANLNTIKIPIPPLEDQQRVVEILDKLTAEHHQHIERLETEIKYHQKSK